MDNAPTHAVHRPPFLHRLLLHRTGIARPDVLKSDCWRAFGGQLPNGLKEDLNALVVFFVSLFQFAQFLAKFRLRCKEFPQADMEGDGLRRRAGMWFALGS